MGSTSLPAAFRLLVDQRSDAAGAALAEALPHLESAGQSAALAVLVERGHSSALREVVARFTGFGKELQDVIIEHAGGLYPAIRRAITSSALEDRLSAIELIVSSCAYTNAYLLAGAVRSRCPQTRERAAAALRDMTEHLLDRSSDQASPKEAGGRRGRAESLADALRTAVLGWEIHFRPEVLDAAFQMGDWVEEAVRKKLQEPRTRIARILGERLERSSRPRLSGFMLRALAIPELRASAVRGISQAKDKEFIRSLISQTWLLADPRVEQGCRWIRNAGWLSERFDDWGLDGSLAAGAVRLLSATAVSHQRKIELYRRLVEVENEELRRAAFWELVRDPSEAAADVLAIVAAHRTDGMATIAARELRRRGAPGHAGPLDRLEVLGALRDRRLAKERADQVFRLAHDPDPVVRSMAVGLLAELPGATSARILRAAVNDPAERVQANAIEALDVLDVDDRAGCTEPKLLSPNSRVRANAVKSLLRLELRKAGDVLLDMLDDPSGGHRLSALWVVEQLKLRSVTQRVIDIGRTDSSERVRQRTRRVLRELTGDSGGGLRAFDVAGERPYVPSGVGDPV